jgi:protoheme IX farnesyltransferase
VAEALDAAEHRHRRPGRRLAAGHRLGRGHREVPWQAWLLLLIIFLWTPPHFWALWRSIRRDYAKAGMPMMPVVAGAKSTRKQILIYSLLFTPLCLVPAFTGLGGMTYLAVAAGGGVIFLVLAWRVFKSRAGDAADPRQDDGLYDVKAAAKDARNLFAFSILYLTLLFATLLAEHLLDLPAFGGF